jgi:LysM repeat protein
MFLNIMMDYPYNKPSTRSLNNREVFQTVLHNPMGKIIPISKLSGLVLFLAILVGITTIPVSGFHQQTGVDFTAYDLIAEVNNVRLKAGLPSVEPDATLMSIAQQQSDYQANTHTSSHGDSSGGNVVDRVKASGYGSGLKIMAGENVAGFTHGATNMLPVVIYEIWSDPGHWGTMTNPKYQHAGAGIATDEITVYITLNLAGVEPETNISVNPTPVQNNPVSLPNNPAPQVPGPATNTPAPDGSIIHFVREGESILYLAGLYQQDPYELIRMNNLDSNVLQIGQRLVMKKADFPTQSISSSIVITQDQNATFTPDPAIESTIIAQTATRNSEPDPVQKGVVIIALILGMLIAIGFMYIRPIRSGWQ